MKVLLGVLSAFLLLAVGACGGSSTPAAAPAASSSAKAPSATSPAPGASALSSTSVGPSPRPDHVTRASVVAVLSRGLGDFLARVDVAPVLVGGRFHGWKIVKFRPDDPLWRGSELAPGDVVTRVNGAPIERPEQAFSVFQTLAVARELRVEYERGGARREFAYGIDDSR